MLNSESQSPGRFKNQLFGLLLVGAGFFWLWFFLAYPYHELIDDSKFKALMEIRSFKALLPHLQSRPLAGILYFLQGKFAFPSAEKSVLISILLHLTVGLGTLKLIIPALPEKARFYAKWGLLAFLVHPISLHTSVHLAERSEILGVLFASLSLGVFLKVKKWSLNPILLLLLLMVLAATSKENYLLVAMIPLAAVFFSKKNWISDSKNVFVSRIAIGATVLALVGVGVSINSYSSLSLGQAKEELYRKSRIFKQSFIDEKEVTPADSVLFPLPDHVENLQIQTALMPSQMKPICTALI